MNKEEKSQEHRFQIRQRFMSQEKFDKVAMREISQDDTKMSNGRIEKKSAHYYLHTSGFTDPNIEIDIRKGLPRIREQWILDRNDVEELSEISSEYGKSV
jgi:phosphomethylpyrimidine synthase